MGMVEDAYEVMGSVDYIVASENLGWSVFAYDHYVSHLTDDTTPRQLAASIVDGYAAAVQGYPATLSVLDVSAIEGVGTAVDTLAQALSSYMSASSPNPIKTVRNNAQTFDSRNYTILNSDDEYIDLYHFAQMVKVSVNDAQVQSAAQGVMDAVAGCVVAEHHQSGYDAWSPNYWDLDDAHGISIYFPPRSGGWDYLNYVTGGSWAFCTETAWDEFLVNYFALTGLDPETPVDPGVPAMQPLKNRIFLPLVTRD
jgi:hypothetical protein